MTDETEKRREFQLLLLREGWTQEMARDIATDVNVKIEEIDKAIERMREHAMRFAERQIVPPGTVDLADMKTKRQETIDEAEAARYHANRDRLGILMAELFSLDEMPMAVLQALLDVLEGNGVDRLEAISEIALRLEVLRKMTKHGRG